MNFFRSLAYPLSLAYGTVGWLRNKLFDYGILRQHTFELPVIVVGNLSMGGTGKTPHIEYLIRLLDAEHKKLCTLSRGYGRRTRGYILAKGHHSPYDIGDEPCQIARKYPWVSVAVAERRVRGIQELLMSDPQAGAILLDDAFQHRHVRPGLSILLTDYFHPYYKDHVVPSGTLRECRKGARRADIIVVTKCPAVLSPITRKSIIERIAPGPGQHIYFSFLRYSDLVPFDPANTPQPDENRKYYAILMFTGIAFTYPLEEHLRRSCVELEVMRFPDHHVFTVNDLKRVRETFCNIVGKNKILVTTEKDRVRLDQPDLKEAMQGLPVFCQPVEVDFFTEDKKWFNKQIIDYAGKNKRNS
jgi:tetraacyldisaccharide 4'-kinase